MDTSEIRSFLHEECQLAQRHTLILGVSGGPDSMGLLHILNDLGFSLLVAHLDHSLRAKSDEDAHFVEREARKLGLEFAVETVSVEKLAFEEKLNLEDAARQSRYSFLFKLAEEKKARAVLVAHHADDQVETILMRLIRGAGIGALIGMKRILQPNQWHPNIPLIRPILNVTRKDILEYCAKNNIDYLEDPSNRNQKYLRNQLRHDLIPKLGKMNPNFNQTLLRNAELLKAENEAMNQFTEIAWQTCIIEGKNKLFSILIPAFNQEPLAIKRRLLLRIFQKSISKKESISFLLIDEALAYLSNMAKRKQIEIANKLYLMKENEWLHFFHEQGALPIVGPQMKASESTSFKIPDLVRLSSGWNFSIRLGKASIHRAPNPFSANCKIPNIGLIELRPRKEGDRFQPIGMKKGSMKISDFMINEKLPKRARKSWPLLAMGNDILWVPGYKISEKIRLDENDIESLHLLFSAASEL